MSEFEKQKQGEIYDPADADIQELQVACLEKMYDYNATRPHEAEQRQALMKEMLAEVGEGCYIEPPLHANFGGHYLHLGHHVYANFNLTLVDDTDIYIGDYTMLGPNVVLAATGHPVLPALRRRGLQFSFGRARILTDDAEIRQAATALGLKYNDNPQAVKAEIDKFWNALACIEITPEHITAKECIELVRKK